MECYADKCERPSVAKGLCLKHYKRMRRYGDPNTLTKTPEHAAPEEALAFHGWTVTESGCWEWSGRRNPATYGLIWQDGADVLAHRLTYTLWVGPIPDGMFVCHACDNPPCINPEHLWVGTPKDNNYDKERKGRGGQLRGSRNPAAKLTEAEVVEIRIRRASGEKLRTISRDYGVSESVVSNIYIRKTWKWLD